MRDVRRNKQTIWYALRTGHTENTDEYGNVTGTFTEVYGEPVAYKVNVSPNKGTIDLERFGLDSRYTRVLTTTDLRCPIAVDSILWIGADPETEPYNFVVERISPSLNQLVILVREVNNISNEVVNP